MHSKSSRCRIPGWLESSLGRLSTCANHEEPDSTPPSVLSCPGGPAVLPLSSHLHLHQSSHQHARDPQNVRHLEAALLIAEFCSLAVEVDAHLRPGACIQPLPGEQDVKALLEHAIAPKSRWTATLAFPPIHPEMEIANNK
eukprot:3576453-Amphidinium_carterae.1